MPLDAVVQVAQAMQPDAGQLRATARVLDGHVDRLPRQMERTLVTQSRPRMEQDGSGGSRHPRQRAVVLCEHPAVHSRERAGADGAPDIVGVEPSGEQLAAGDHAVLPVEERAEVVHPSSLGAGVTTDEAAAEGWGSLPGEVP